MGYHVSIVRTGLPEKTIRQEEIVSVVEGQFGFELERDDAGSIKQVSREVSGEEVLLFYDEGELWAKTPGETTLRTMIEIARALGNGARVRGDEGETYKSVTKTFHHPDDAHLLEETPKIYWKDVVSWALPILAGLSFIYGFGTLLLRYLSKTFGFGS